MALHTLPSALPFDDIQYLVGELTSGTGDTRQLVASGFAVAEYAVGQLLPGQRVYKVVGRPTKLHSASLKTELDKVIAVQTGSASAGANATPDWHIIAQMVMALLQLWLGRL